MTTKSYQPGDLGGLLSECLRWIRQTDYVSFVELENWLAEHGMDVKGEYGLEAGPNVFLWTGMSQEFVHFAIKLRTRVDLAPVSTILVYAADGGMPNLPVAKRPPRAGYRQPHWLPVTMRARRAPA